MGQICFKLEFNEAVLVNCNLVINTHINMTQEFQGHLYQLNNSYIY